MKLAFMRFKFRYRFRYSFICQGTSTRRQRGDLFVLRIFVGILVWVVHCGHFMDKRESIFGDFVRTSFI